MEFRATEQSSLTWSGDCLVIGLFEDTTQLTGALAELDQTLSGLLKELIDETEFKATAGNSVVTRVSNGPIRKIGLVGLGKPEILKFDTLRRAAAAIARLARREKCKSLGISLPICAANPDMTAQAIAEGVILALHQDQRFKSEAKEGGLKLERVDLLELAGQEAAIQRAQQICEGVILARELVAAPPNIVTAVTLAETAAAIANDSGMELKILEQEDCEKLGMGAYLGVAQASDLPPKFIHLVYRPAGTPRRKVAIVGKGLTFDSGGLNIKVAGSGIENMKTDMGGAAATSAVKSMS